LKYDTGLFPIDLQLGFHKKDFGANSFYTSKYPWQYEKTKGFFGYLSAEFNGKGNIKPELSYKLHYDNFQLFRESVYQYRNGYFIRCNDTAQYAPGVYYPGHNYHKTRSMSAAVNMHFVSRTDETVLRLSLTGEKILSNKLGHDLENPVKVSDRVVYTKSDRRVYWNFYAARNKTFQRFTLGGAVNFLYNTQFGPHVNGSGFITYKTGHFIHHFSIRSASRLPTFTDLYYEGPANTGNPDLKPETATTYEAGSKFFHRNTFISADVFLRNARNTIDWVKENPAEKWQPRNLTALRTYGFELSFQKKFEHPLLEKLKISYAYIEMKKDENTAFVSKYVLDFLRHKFVMEFRHRFFFDTKIHWTGIYKERNGQYLDYVDGAYRLFDYEPYFLTHVKLAKTWQKIHLALSVENLFNVDYRDLSYIKMPGRWAIFELGYKIDLN
jgi:iron complex outermembrane receptor protein